MKDSGSIAAKTDAFQKVIHPKGKKTNNFIISKISQVKQRNPLQKSSRDETVNLAGLLPEHLRDLKPISAWQKAL